jgi:hypothetical protein
VQALLLTMLLSFSQEARANAARFLELESACPITADALERRVGEGLVGERDPALAASITIRETQGGYEVALRTHHRGLTLATKVVTAPSCDEAVEAATVVLALALGEPAPTPVASAAPARPQPPPIAAPVRPSVGVQPRPQGLPQEHERQPARHTRDSLRVALSAGLDVGTLPASTAYAAAGFSRSVAELELYGVLSYGAPYVDESASDVESERTRHDFGALELGACYGLGRHLRVSACASGELGVVRVSRARWTEGTALETDVARPRLSGVMTTLLAYRGSPIEPQLELAAVVLAAGKHESSPPVGPGVAATRVGLRAGLGAAVPF